MVIIYNFRPITTPFVLVTFDPGSQSVPCLQRFPTNHTPSIARQPIDDTSLMPYMSALWHHRHDISRLELTQADGTFENPDS
jgi:non-ribosomal peptide synthetase component E (peptide arylation enzyme)